MTKYAQNYNLVFIYFIDDYEANQIFGDGVSSNVSDSIGAYKTLYQTVSSEAPLDVKINALQKEAQGIFKAIQKPTAEQKAMHDLIMGLNDTIGVQRRDAFDVVQVLVQKGYQNTQESIGKGLDHMIFRHYGAGAEGELSTREILNIGKTIQQGKLSQLTTKEAGDLSKTYNTVSVYTRMAGANNDVKLSVVVGERHNGIKEVVTYYSDRNIGFSHTGDNLSELSTLKPQKEATSSTPPVMEKPINKTLHQTGLKSDKLSKQEWKANLKEWHKDSHPLTKNEDGSPLKVYHGTTGDFDKFDISNFGKTDEGYAGKGFYFTNDKNIASDYATNSIWNSTPKLVDGGNVMPVYINIKNPYISDVYDISDTPMKGYKTTQQIKDMGHDGVIITHSSEANEYVAFNPNQIKSIHNKGTFDESNPNILYQTAKDPLQTKKEIKITERQNGKMTALDVEGNMRGSLLIMPINNKFTARADFYTGGSTTGTAIRVEEKAKFETYEEAYEFLKNIAETRIVASDGSNPNVLYQSINKETKEVDIEAFNKFAEPLSKSDNVLEFVKDFAKPITTPIGDFKVDTAYMLNKAMERDGGLRINQIGYIKPTLERPAYIIEVDGKFHFIKPFIDESDNVKKFLSVVSDRDGNVKMVTSHILQDKNLKALVKKGNVIEDFVKKNDTEHITLGGDTPQGLEPKSRPNTHTETIPPKDLNDNKPLYQKATPVQKAFDTTQTPIVIRTLKAIANYEPIGRQLKKLDTGTHGLSKSVKLHS